MNKKKSKIVFWIILIVVISACMGNIFYAIFATASNTSNILTAISGWISGIATLVIGIIAYLQNRTYKNNDEKNEKYIDVIVESVEINSIQIRSGQMARQSLWKDTTQYSGFAFYLYLFSYSEKPVFDIRVSELKVGDKVYKYDDIQPIYKDPHGRSFLTKDNTMMLLANIPKNFTNNEYTITIKMKNQYDEWYKKEISFNYNKNILPHCYGVKQSKSFRVE